MRGWGLRGFILIGFGRNFDGKGMEKADGDEQGEAGRTGG